MKKILLSVFFAFSCICAFSWGTDQFVHTEPVGRSSVIATSAGILYCSVPSGTTGQRGIDIMMSTDFGASWNLVTNLSNGQLVAKSKMLVTGTDSVYCAYLTGGNLYFYNLQSHTRHSYTFHTVADFDVVASPNANVLYVFVDEAGTDYLFYRTTLDGGTTWTGIHGTVSVSAASPRATMDGTRLLLSYYGPVLSSLSTSEIVSSVWEETSPGQIISHSFSHILNSGVNRPQFGVVLTNMTAWLFYSVSDTLQEIRYMISTDGGNNFSTETVFTGNATTFAGCFDFTQVKLPGDSGIGLVWYSEVGFGPGQMNYTFASSSDPSNFSTTEIFHDFSPACTDDDTYPSICQILSDVAVTFFEEDASVSSLYFDMRSMTAGLPDDKMGAVFRIYPNPVLNELHIETTIAASEKVYSIKDICGKEIQRVVLNGTHNSVELNDLSSGIYLLDNGSGKTERFIKL